MTKNEAFFPTVLWSVWVEITMDWLMICKCLWESVIMNSGSNYVQGAKSAIKMSCRICGMSGSIFVIALATSPTQKIMAQKMPLFIWTTLPFRVTQFYWFIKKVCRTIFVLCEYITYISKLFKPKILDIGFFN